MPVKPIEGVKYAEPMVKRTLWLPQEFYEDEINCLHCDAYREERISRIPYCRRTSEYLPNAAKFVGAHCPLIEIKEAEHENTSSNGK